jgi:hypothetical protein
MIRVLRKASWNLSLLLMYFFRLLYPIADINILYGVPNSFALQFPPGASGNFHTSTR